MTLVGSLQEAHQSFPQGHSHETPVSKELALIHAVILIALIQFSSCCLGGVSLLEKFFHECRLFGHLLGVYRLIVVRLVKITLAGVLVEALCDCRPAEPG